MAANRLKLNTNKTELIWTGSKASLLRQGRYIPALHLGHDSIAASDHVRLLGATVSSDLSLHRHVANVSSTGIYSLRHLRRVRRSLYMYRDSVTIPVHAYVSSRVDYCNILLAGAPKVVTDRLQRVMNAAARVLSSTHKYYSVGRPGPPNVEVARRDAGSVCIALTRQRTMFLYYSSLLLIYLD